MDQAWQHVDDLTAVQDERLGPALAWASRSPFYQRHCDGRFPVDRRGLERLPLTTKQDLRDAYPFGLLAVEPSAVAHYHESSGTGGVPTPSFYTADDWADVEERYVRKWVGIEASDVFLVRTPYALMMTGHMAHGGARRQGAMVVPGDNRSVVMPYSRVLRVLTDLNVTLTWSLPTETLIWAQAARAAGREPGRDFPALRAMFVAGEPLTTARRRRIEEIWRVPVLDEYGSTETGPLAGQCREGHLHLWADRILFEVHDPATGRLASTGRGQLVVTPLRRQAMPLLRYNLEDDVEVSAEPCRCGSSFPTVRVLGRSAQGYRIGDTVVTQAGLEDAIFTLPIELGIMFWRARVASDRLEVQFEVAEEYRKAACAALGTAIHRRYHLSAEVTGLPPGSLVPHHVLTATAEVLKPRGLFGPDQDWDHALLYY